MKVLRELKSKRKNVNGAALKQTFEISLGGEVDYHEAVIFKAEIDFDTRLKSMGYDGNPDNPRMFLFEDYEGKQYNVSRGDGWDYYLDRVIQITTLNYPFTDSKGRIYNQYEVVDADISLEILYDTHQTTSKEIIQAIKEFDHDQEPEISILESHEYSSEEFLVSIDGKEYWVYVQYIDGPYIARIVGDGGTWTNFEKAGLGCFIQEDVIEAINEYNE